MTGIALDSTDPKADHAELTAAGVDVDAEIMGGDGVVPLLFFFRDQDGNHLMIVETPPKLSVWSLGLAITRPRVIARPDAG